ncbi:MAG: trans-2-enoyl-CoA reductase family protein [Pseudomonadales bacterium]|nr:trans-2-enoyl-CoA reductase family protein [Pseudomonadales bacterium]
MIIKPKVRGFICINAHPAGCAANVHAQISHTRLCGTVTNGPKNVLVIGCSTGYGLASRITAAFGSGAKTLGICFEKPPTETKTASAGYYNTVAFHEEAEQQGLYAHTLNADAFSQECKQQVIDILQREMGKVDLVVYSLAAPRRTDPVSGETYSSVLKPVGQAYTAKNLNTDTRKISEITIEPASAKEIADTIKVMGGEDWELWIDALAEANLLAPACQTVAYTYLGDKLTWPIYGKATIGKAKEDLDRAASALRAKMAGIGGMARVAVLKAVVTQASSAIPVMPLYLSILFRVMKDADVHEGCIEQLQRLFRECLYHATPRLDANERYRVDDKELDPEIQAEVETLWEQVTEQNLEELTDFRSYQHEFLKLFGFEVDGIDYDADISPLVPAKF